MHSQNYQRQGESDQQTVTQTQTIQQPIVTLEYLLNQNKMKQIALNKATHLIELYKIELQVKQQDYRKQLENIKEIQQEKYQEIITELEEKIMKLEKQIKQYEHKIKQLQSRPVEYPEMSMLNQSGCRMHNQSNTSRIPRMMKNNSNKQLSKDKKPTGRWSHKKSIPSNHTNQIKRSLSTFITADHSKQQQIYRVQKTFLINYLLKSEQKDDKIFSNLSSQIQIQLQILNQKVVNIKMNDKETQYMLKTLRQNYTKLENRSKEYKEIIKIQELIIEEFNKQGQQYQNLFQVLKGSLQQIYQKSLTNQYSQIKKSRFIQTTQSIINSGNIFQHFTDSIHLTEENITRKIKHHKNFIKDKIINMENQNKQLKRILDDMIKLIKSNKKIQMTNFGTIRNPKSNNIEEFNLPQSYKSSFSGKR